MIWNFLLTVLLEQWFSNCGTRTTSGTRRGLFSVFLHKKYIYRCSFYLSGSVNRFLNFVLPTSLTVF